MGFEHGPFTGGCLCGAVRYEATGVPFGVTHCHCLDCRRSSGAAFVTWASFQRGAFRFTAGRPRSIAWAGRLRSFCANCGSPLTFEPGRESPEIDVAVFSLDHPEGIVVGDHTWTVDRVPGLRIDDGLPQFARDRRARD